MNWRHGGSLRKAWRLWRCKNHGADEREVAMLIADQSAHEICICYSCGMIWMEALDGTKIFAPQARMPKVGERVRTP